MGFNFLFPHFPATFDVFLISLSNNTSTNLAAKFRREQLFFRSLRTSSALRIPRSSSDVLTSSIVTAGGAVASLYRFGVDTTGWSTSELKDNSLSSIPGLGGVVLGGITVEDGIKLALEECAMSRLLDGAADSMWDVFTLLVAKTTVVEGIKLALEECATSQLLADSMCTLLVAKTAGVKLEDNIEVEDCVMSWLLGGAANPSDSMWDVFTSFTMTIDKVF